MLPNNAKKEKKTIIKKYLWLFLGKTNNLQIKNREWSQLSMKKKKQKTKKYLAVDYLDKDLHAFQFLGEKRKRKIAKIMLTSFSLTVFILIKTTHLPHSPINSMQISSSLSTFNTNRNDLHLLLIVHSSPTCFHNQIL